MEETEVLNGNELLGSVLAEELEKRNNYAPGSKELSMSDRFTLEAYSLLLKEQEAANNYSSKLSDQEIAKAKLDMEERVKMAEIESKERIERYRIDVERKLEEAKLDDNKQQRKLELIKEISKGGMFAISLGSTAIWQHRSMKFEETGTYRSSISKFSQNLMTPFTRNIGNWAK